MVLKHRMARKEGCQKEVTLKLWYNVARDAYKKKPTDDMFVGELSLRQWVKASTPNKIMEFIDGNLLRTEQGDVLAIMELGLECSKELLEERIGIKDVIIKFNKIKWQIL